MLVVIQQPSSNNEQLTTSFTYNNKNQLVKVVKPNADVIEYTYDGNGNRYSKTINGTARYYHYDTSGNIVSEYKRVILNGSEESQTLVRYVRDNTGKAISMLQYPEPGTPNPVPSTYYFVYNGHGDVTALTDASGAVVATYSYDEFGNLTSSTGNIYNPLRYSGAHNSYYDSETSLYKMGTRYYQPDIGRWLTRDSFKGFQDQTQTQNKYAFTDNNPITKVDPTGHLAQSVKDVIAGARAGDIILTYDKGSPYRGLTDWTHALMKVGGKGDKSRYVEANTPAAGGIANKGKEVFTNRTYNEASAWRVKSRYRSKAIRQIQTYADRSKYPFLHFNFFSHHRSFLDGINCSELVWSAWYQASNGRVDMSGHYSPGRVLYPDAFTSKYTNKTVLRVGPSVP